MFSQFEFQQAVKLLSTPPDGSRCNQDSRKKARNHLVDWADKLMQFGDKNPSTRIALISYHEAYRILKFVISLGG